MTFTFGLVTNLLNIAVMILIAKKKGYAPIAAVAIQFLWIAYVILMGPDAYPMLLTTIPVMAIWAIAVPKWRREK